MILAHKIALDPTVKQREYFERAAGCDRFVWNTALAEWNRRYEAGEHCGGMAIKRDFNEFKYEAFPWLADIHRDAHADAFERLQKAWTAFFAALKRGDPRAGKPKFKKKGRCRESFYVANDKLRIEGERIRLPVLGWVRMREALRFEGRICGVVVGRDGDRWFASIQVDVPDEKARRKRKADGIAGADWGLKNALTITRDDGEKIGVEAIAPPKPLKKALRRLRRLQRKMSRRTKGGSNWNKAVRAVRRMHAQVASIRRDFWNKVTTRLCSDNQAVGIEDLNASGMLQNRRLARTIADVGCREFRRQMEYKAALYGDKLVVADRWFPSSKVCSRCGAKKLVLGLGDRVFHCDRCGHEQDRDENASWNLYALAKRVGAACAEMTPGDSTACKAAG